MVFNYIFLLTKDNVNVDVLSLFDGVSCARIALDNLGLNIVKYYTSEIDKHAINVSKTTIMILFI